ASARVLVCSRCTGWSGAFNGAPADDTAAFTTAFESSSYSSLKEFINEKATLTVFDATLTCSSRDPDETTQPLRDTYVEWVHSDSEGFSESSGSCESFTASHDAFIEGPCEILCDDVRVTTAPTQLSYDHDACLGSSVLTFYWLALHSSTWQVYVTCAPLEGTTSTGTTSKYAVSGASIGTSTSTTTSMVSSAAGSKAASNSSSLESHTTTRRPALRPPRPKRPLRRRLLRRLRRRRRTLHLLVSLGWLAPVLAAGVTTGDSVAGASVGAGASVAGDEGVEGASVAGDEGVEGASVTVGASVVGVAGASVVCSVDEEAPAVCSLDEESVVGVVLVPPLLPPTANLDLAPVEVVFFRAAQLMYTCHEGECNTIQ
ncbi:hypothetical protein PI124_g15461, partial [Phytophthora idaei]